MNTTIGTEKRLLSVKQVCAKTSLSRTAIWKKLQSDSFPKPIKLGDGIRKAFLEHEIDAWIDQLTVARDRQAKG